MWVVSVFLICMVCLPGIISIENRGKLFITAFPENVAYYDPVEHDLALFVTAVTHDTTVTVKVGSVLEWTSTLTAAGTERVPLNSDIELDRSQLSDKSVVITSTKDITVIARSKRNNTVQFLMLQPVNSLGKTYYIPNLSPTLTNASLPGFADFHDARGKIVIINSEKNNRIKMHFSGGDLRHQDLRPYFVFQLNISDSLPFKITTQHNVVILLTHPCSNTTLCNCQMVVTQLQATTTWGTTFLVPKAFNLIDSKTHLMVTSDETSTLSSTLQLVNGSISPDSGSHLVFDLKTQYLISSSNFSVMLIQPGHAVELIPVSGFSACYYLHKTRSNSKALVIAPTSNTSQVHLGTQSGIGGDWKTIDSQPYSWAEVELTESNYSIIWHPSTKIGVYVNDGGKWKQALSIAKEPGPEGCLVEAKGYSVIDESGTWAEAIGHCQQINGELVSINNEEHQQELSKGLRNPSNEREVWVGLRRRLLNGEWYWLNRQSINITKWASGQPGDSQEKYCASMSLSSNNHKNLRWNAKNCCTDLKPVCLKDDIYFPLEVPESESVSGAK